MAFPSSTNDVLELELAAAGTQFSADETARSPFATLIEGDRWMIYRNSLTGVLHWDFASFPPRPLLPRCFLTQFIECPRTLHKLPSD
jgi:hypothetical protein